MSALGRDGLEIGVGDGEQLVARGDTGLDELDEPRAGPARDRDLRGGRERVDVGLALMRGLRGDDADLVVAGGCDGSADRRTDDLDDGDVIALASVVEHRGRGRVAGDHQSLDPAVHQTVEAFEGELADLGDGTWTVGLPGGVTQVDHRLVRQLVQDGPGNGQSTEAAVEDPDRCVRHGFEPSRGGPPIPNPGAVCSVTRRSR